MWSIGMPNCLAPSSMLNDWTLLFLPFTVIFCPAFNSVFLPVFLFVTSILPAKTHTFDPWLDSSRANIVPTVPAIHSDISHLMLFPSIIFLTFAQRQPIIILSLGGSFS